MKDKKASNPDQPHPDRLWWYLLLVSVLSAAVLKRVIAVLLMIRIPSGRCYFVRSFRSSTTSDNMLAP